LNQKNGSKVSYHQRIMNVLADGEWHSLRDIDRAVARFIDADIADIEYRRRHPRWEQDTAHSTGLSRLI
jgi:hypothetical protein